MDVEYNDDFEKPQLYQSNAYGEAAFGKGFPLLGRKTADEHILKESFCFPEILLHAADHLPRGEIGRYFGSLPVS